jgi:hypothetical protein
VPSLGNLVEILFGENFSKAWFKTSISSVSRSFLLTEQNVAPSAAALNSGAACCQPSPLGLFQF